MFRRENIDGVAVRLGHFLPVGPRNDRDRLFDLRFRNGKHLAIGGVEFDRDVACHLHMLFLVFAHRNHIRLIQENVGGHEHGIGKKAVGRGNAFCHLVFVRMASFQQSDGRNIVQVPGQFGDFRDVRLHPKHGFVGVDAKSQHVEYRIFRIIKKLFPVEQGGQAVHVGNETEQFPFFLRMYHRLDHSQVIADV